MFLRLSLLLILATGLLANSWKLSLDNDIFFQSDDSYTGGMTLSYLSNDYNKTDTNELSRNYVKTLKSVSDFLHLTASHTRQINAAFSLQEVIITPSELNTTQANYSDIPYIGFLGAHFSLYSSNSVMFEQFRVTLGVVGHASGAQWLQESIHNSVNNDLAQGWHNQLGPYISVGVGYLRGMKNYETSLYKNIDFEWFNSYHADVGNTILGVGGGSMLRIGSHMPDNFTVFSTLFNNSSSQLLNLNSRSKEFGWAFNMGLSTDIIAYSYLFHEAKNQGYSVEASPLIIGAEAGVSIYVDNLSFEMKLYPTQNSKQTNLHNSWGRFSVSWYFE